MRNDQERIQSLAKIWATFFVQAIVCTILVVAFFMGHPQGAIFSTVLMILLDQIGTDKSRCGVR
jgi:uncharacterized membrane protein